VGDADELRRQLRRALGDSDHEDATERLLAEARAEAETRVRSILADVYSDLLLDRVRAAVTRGAAPAATEPPAAAPAPATTEPSPVAPAPEPAPATDPGELGWYVYCIVAADHDPLPANLEGVDPRHPVSLLEQGGVTAVVSPVPLADFGEEPLREHLSDMAWLERTARRHEQVQEEVARGGTPIPMRLCSIYRDESGVRRMLTREEPALLEAIDHLRGKAEWGVKGFIDLDAADAADAGAPAPDLGRSAGSTGSGGGAAYMQNRLEQRRRRETAAARVDEACDVVHTALCAVAVDGVTAAPHRPEATGRDVPMVFNASYLVADADFEAFHRELDRLSEEVAPLGLALERTGPWPPYNFVPGTIGAAW
jgi:Gas vesicle synthesis protein GvpL/GvpF